MLKGLSVFLFGSLQFPCIYKCEGYAMASFLRHGIKGVVGVDCFFFLVSSVLFMSMLFHSLVPDFWDMYLVYVY